MPHYSPFWDKHYEEIGNCCMTEPLDHYIMFEGDRSRGYLEKYIENIDVSWMYEKKFKWIGWDKEENIAWITPGGMIYNFKDLERNEKGKQWEKDHGKMELLDDGNLPSYLSLSGLYEDELEIQKNCGFCPDKKSIPVPEPDYERERILNDTSTAPNWQEYARGAAPENNPVVNTDYVTQAYKYANQYGPDNVTTPPIPYAPPAPPTDTPPPINPVLKTPINKHREDVLTAPKSPFQKVMDERKKAAQDTGLGYKFNPDPIDNLRVKPVLKPNTPPSEYKFPDKPFHLAAYKEQLKQLKQNIKQKAKPSSQTKKGNAADFNIDAAVVTLNKNAGPKSQHACAAYVRAALEAGGVNTIGHPVPAKDYVDFLREKGFNEVNPENYKPQKGDIIVIQNYLGGNINGHIEMYNGEIWVSDFRQDKDIWPGSGYRASRPPYNIFRK